MNVRCMAAVVMGMAAAGARAADYFIHPVSGSDAAAGTSRAAAWKSFAPLNARTLGPGDTVSVLAPGPLTASLAPKGAGTPERPIAVTFAPGDYDWMHEGLVRHKLFISNTIDDVGPKAAAMDLIGLRNAVIAGEKATFFMRGKTVMIHLKDSSGITFRGFGLDYRRPTVSEYTAEKVTGTDAVIRIHPDSKYRLEGKKVVWVYGDGENRNTGRYVQCFDRASGRVWRNGRPAIDANATAIEELAPGLLKVTFSKNPGFTEGMTYQHRSVRRDCAGIFCEDSSDIVYDRVRLHFLHGMGVVSQFTRNITFRDVDIAPRAGSGRTCAAWADMLHFSGCAGHILITGTHFDGANDDAINVHGTHLRLIRSLGPRRAEVRFMHPQTWGFKAFRAGDEVAFVRLKTLVPYAEAKIASAALSKDGKTMALEFDRDLPADVKYNSDALENTTWTPRVTIRDCEVEHIPTRGFLLTTRRPILVENVRFRKTVFSAIRVADDAAGWFESGPVTDMTVRGCLFDLCGNNAVNICPENRVADPAHPVHSNIRVTGNTFRLRSARDKALFLKSASNVLFADNVIEGAEAIEKVVAQRACTNVDVKNNRAAGKQL